MRTWARIGFAAVVLAGASPAHAKDAALTRGPQDTKPIHAPTPDGWSYCKSREQGAGIRLRIEAEGTEAAERMPVADTMVLQYIPRGNYGRHKSVSIDGGDKNRMYIRFDLSKLPDNAMLTLRLATLRGSKPLSKPMQVGVYPALETWDEGSLTWTGQPKVSAEPAATFQLGHADGWNEIDVTALANSEHGWMLKATNPVAPTPSQFTGGGTGTTKQDADPLKRRKGDPPKGSGGAPDGYSWFRQREHGAGMFLRVEQADGTTAERAPTADTLLIEYIPDRGFGGHVSGSLDGAAQNQVLVRFDENGLDTAKRLVLRLALLAGPKPLDKPMAVGIYRVKAPWKEYGTTWTNQPAVEAEPLQTFDLSPDDGWLEVDVTDSVKKGAEHGWLLRAANPVKKTVAPVASKGKANAWRQDALAVVSWAHSAAEAMQSAKAHKRPVLTLIRASHNAQADSAMEDIFLATVLADPRVHALVREQFVAYRTFQRGWTYTVGKPLPRDPLHELGIASHEIKPLALVVSSPKGEVLRTLQSIGTFDAGFVYRFLSDGKDIPQSRSEDRVSYLTGVRDPDEREKHFSEIPGDSLWQLKVRAWELWPDRMEQFERSDPVAYAKHARKGSTEVKRGAVAAPEILERAMESLISMQRPDGSWGNPVGYATQDSAITALAATAIARRLGDAAGNSTWLESAAEADEHIRAAIKKADPASLNAWGGAYLVDYFLGAYPKRLMTGVTRAVAERMIEILQAGQLESGAWSYDLNFGKNWRGGFGGWPVTTKGRAHSMNTGPALVSLAEAKIAGLKVSDNVLNRGARALLAMRDAPAVFTYTWPEPRNFNTLKASIGRACGCEHALFLLGKNKREDLELAIDTFMENREHFWRIAKVTAGWSPPRSISSYFCLFAYYHAARAIRASGGPKQAERLALIRKDVLEHVEVDATWLDYEGTGKGYGTAMGLLLLDLTDPKRKR